MPPRFYAPDLDPRLERVMLGAEEARHLVRVLRLKAGDEVLAFDGRGVEFRAVVEAAGRATASLRLQERLPAQPSPTVRITIAQAVLKGGSMDGAVRDATMMGAEVIQPLLTAHADVKAAVVRRDETLKRWRRVALASTKQSRRAILPLVLEPRPFDEWIEARADDFTILFAEPSASCTPRPVKALMSDSVPTHAAVLLGPEGGWAPGEIAAAVRTGCIPVTLGSLTLRAESMPVVALAALAAIWEV